MICITSSNGRVRAPVGSVLVVYRNHPPDVLWIPYSAALGLSMQMRYYANVLVARAEGERVRERIA